MESTATTYEESNTPIVFERKSQRQLAFGDFFTGLKEWRTWLLLAYLDIRLRYRRSVLGPFWITLSMAITVYTMGYLYGHLFHSDLQSYFPYLTAGMLGWALTSNTIMELTDTFTNYEGMLKQIKLPYSLYVHRVAMRNILIFFHNLLVIIPVLLMFHQVAKVNFYTLLLIPGLMIFYVLALTYGMIFAMIGARYRDVSQIVKSLIQVVFFLTPIMWRPEVLPADKQFIVKLNPFHSILEMIRAPLLGMVPSAYDFCMVLGVTVLGMIGCYKLFTRYRARIVYWV